MFKRNLLPVWIVIILTSGMFLMGQDSWPPQSDPCDPDPCAAIERATTDTCTVVDGTNFTCECEAGSSWKEATETCEELPAGDMVQIPPGCFDMGDSSDSCISTDWCPVHNVCISAFEMDVHEVTNAEYAECVTVGACSPPSRSSSNTRFSYFGDPAYDDYPVIYVDWDQATNYCAWAGKRLPAEAEWEYAARGGLAQRRYPWGDEIGCDDANCARDAGPCTDYGGLENDTHEVGSYPANGYGLYDVAGNVFEWVEDDYHASYNCDPYPHALNCWDGGVAPSDGSAWVHDPRYLERVIRGGAWDSWSFMASTVANRPWRSITYGSNSNYLGFRCARGGAYGP